MILIETSFSDKNIAQKFAKELLNKKLCACVNILLSQSLYSWNNKIIDEDEFILRIKTTKEFQNKVINFLQKNHPYETPEIIVSEVSYIEEKYQNWLKNSLKS